MTLDQILALAGIGVIVIGGFAHLSSRLAVIESKVDLLYDWWKEHCK